MSLNSDPPPGLVAQDPQTREAAEAAEPVRLWPRRLLLICLALFTFEIGLFLVVFPWTDNWHINYFQELSPRIQDLWEEPSFRGALTGLGFVNLYIACLQVISAFRRR